VRQSRGLHLEKEARLTSHAEQPPRRDFLILAANTFAAVGGALAMWPFIAQMSPDASTQALASIEVDLTPIKEGQAITAMWRGKPIFIRNRTKEEIEKARAVPLSELPDPEPDAKRVKAGHDNWLVMVGICTHLGCIPKGQGMTDAKGDYGGWFCPCHGSHYDTAGRVRKGPAPRNLAVPPYAFESESKIKIG
jgi:ubiquinol-cytochrome c reductase iron-sulfur subunit